MSSSEPRSASQLLKTDDLRQLSEPSQPSAAPKADDPRTDARVAIIDAVFETIWPGRWKGVTVLIDGEEHVDPLSVWRANVANLHDWQFEAGIDWYKRCDREWPPTPGQFGVTCRGMAPPIAPAPDQPKRLQQIGMTDRQRELARYQIRKMRELLRN
jgi:hypothetical protein